VTEDEIIITDPESEYAPLVNALQGEVVRISINSSQYINPLDLNLDYSEEKTRSRSRWTSSFPSWSWQLAGRVGSSRKKNLC
jgi:type IV secretory pathway VirB4 component